MDFSKFTYRKGDPKQTLKESILREEPIRKVNARENKEAKIVISSNISPDYQKGESFRTPALIFIISGGEKREKDILKVLIKEEKVRALRVLFLSKENQGLQPYQMQERWQAIRQSGEFKINSQVYHLDKMDKVFLLTDVDEFYDQLLKILSSKTVDDDGCWIISNPCIEIWLYFCYRNEPEVDLVSIKLLDVKERSKKFKTLGNTLVKGGFNFNYAFEHLHEGIEHSLEYYKEDENGIPVLFATQMHKLAQFIIDTMNANANEYEEYVKRQKLSWKEKIRKK